VLDTPAEFREYGWRVLWDSAGLRGLAGCFRISALVFQGWWAKIGALRTLDLAAPAAAIGYGIGRIGCFLSGDGCYGIPTTLHGDEFSAWMSRRLCGCSLHRSTSWRQGWRSAHGFGGGAANREVRRDCGEYLVLSGIARFLVEFVRVTEGSLGLSNAQLASAGSVVVGLR